MAGLLYFNPDPQVPDSDLLGYGDLMFDDGSSRYVSGDPDLVYGLGPAPMGPPEPPGGMQGLSVDQMGNILQDGQPLMSDPMTGQPMPPVEMPQPTGQDALSRGIRSVGEALEVPPLAEYGNEPQELAPLGAFGGQGITVQTDTGQPVTVTQTGEIIPGGGGVPLEQAMQQSRPQQQPGFMPYERQGAMPQDMAQRQLYELGNQQNAAIAATEQARRDQGRMVNELTLQQLAANEARRVEQERIVADEQAKIQRWQAEQQQIVDMNIEDDLMSAAGPVGGLMAVAGAALLGFADRPEVGLRMIENRIDRHVRAQVQQRNTRLGLLADKIGSSQQALQMGKAALYKATADRMEILAQKTQNDIYESQTPAMVETMRQKALENLQAAEQSSMGKLIERMPAPPKPPDPAMMQRYGELRRERDASVGIAQRAEQQLGLRWQPGQNGQPGYYVNKDEVLKNGIQGVGNLEQWVPDFVYSTLGGQTAEGYQVRGTAEAMAYAQIRQMQPTGPISNADIQAAVKAGALDTEEGFLRGLERIRTSAEQQRDNDVRQYGPDIVGTFEMRGSGPDAMNAPAASRAPTLEELRGGSALLRQGQNTGTSSEAAKLQPGQRMAQAAEDIQAMGTEAGLGPEGIQILIAQAGHESGNGDSEGAAAGNMFGHKRTGNRAGFEANTTEGEGANARRTRAEFALYPTIADGVADHVSLLQRRYQRAWEALQVGDVDGYVAALKDGGYFTGNEEAYRNALLRRL